METSEIFEKAKENYSAAQDLAILVDTHYASFSRQELSECQDIFAKWIKHFKEEEKNACNKRQKRNSSYLKNRFLEYYRSAF